MKWEEEGTVMKNRLITTILIFVILLTALPSCSIGGTNSGSGQPVPATGTGAIVTQGDSRIIGKAINVNQRTSGYPWEVEFLLLNSDDVDGSQNPTKDSVGHIITAETDQDIHGLDPSEIFVANIKAIGDVSKPGGIFYMSDSKEIHLGTATDTPSGDKNVIVQGDSVVIGKTIAVRKGPSFFPWEAEFVILNSDDINNAPNLTKNKVGQTLVAEADQDIHGLDPGEIFIADVQAIAYNSNSGTIFYLFNEKEIH